MDRELLLEIKNLCTFFLAEDQYVSAVRNLDLSLYRGEILGLVGESGCGKSVTSKSILRLYNGQRHVQYDGDILFENQNILSLSEKEMRELRKKEISMIFQDPSNSLNPLLTVEKQLVESIMLSGELDKGSAIRSAEELLEKCGIVYPKERLKAYPHELSGGMQQRVMIAMAIAKKPKLLIADEPTTALDVTIQAQILEIFKSLNQEEEMAILFITHDLAVVKDLCHRVAVMYMGEIVEIADKEALFRYPMHPYTDGLINCIPELEGDRKHILPTISGTVQSLYDVPIGCSFAARCEKAEDICYKRNPKVVERRENHFVKCHFPYNQKERECEERDFEKH